MRLGRAWLMLLVKMSRTVADDSDETTLMHCRGRRERQDSPWMTSV